MLLGPENPIAFKFAEDNSKPSSPSCPLHNKVSFPGCTPLMLFQFIHVFLGLQTELGFSSVARPKGQRPVSLHSLNTTLLSMRSQVPGTLWAQTLQCWQRMSLKKPRGGEKRVRTAMRGWEGVKE